MRCVQRAGVSLEIRKAVVSQFNTTCLPRRYFAMQTIYLSPDEWGIRDELIADVGASEKDRDAKKYRSSTDTEVISWASR